ncbi:OB-fold protein [Xenorhabdus hominickii]|uniref:Uncharacterized protein n=1 Tax=Xenorhabdus hominickii TaxID=351679 RepID=A0A2G0Q089_XENHO|nr:hypothetical protein [Xenorhabdus hominickii]AOM42702.1 hypothetical protein A9255_20455 [Xenorhabdus hominickii]PHM52644.1 hypothetical protein Xhom_04312 [Xenorhabdus hominickii]
MKKVLKWIGIVFVVLIVIGFIAGKGEDKSSGDVSVSSNSSSGKKSISLTEKEAEFINSLIENDANTAFSGGNSMIKPDVIFVTAKELQQNYAENEARGDRTYKDKDLVITGIVSSIDSSLGDIPVVTLKTNDLFNSVHIRFKKQYRDTAIDLNKNQKVTFFCQGNGVMLGSPTVSNCSPVDVAKNDFINKQKQYVNKAINGDKNTSEGIISIIALAKVVGEQSNDFSSCEKIDKKCFTSVAPTLQKAAKNIETSPAMQEIKEVLGH